MGAQFPLPSFEDIRKTLQFWIDQQDKWFYYENELILSGTSEDSGLVNYSFAQTRVVGKIHDVISYPPSLLLKNTTVHYVEVVEIGRIARIVSPEKRAKYGMVLSQVAYYHSLPVKCC